MKVSDAALQAAAAIIGAKWGAERIVAALQLKESSRHAFDERGRVTRSYLEEWKRNEANKSPVLIALEVVELARCIDAQIQRGEEPS